jgi:CBS domain containing-hemolysin-like protein
VSGWIWLAVLSGLLLPALSLQTSLLERSGPIRLRHWVEESGSRLRALYEDRRRFEVYRYLLNLLAKLVPLALFATVARAAVGGGLAFAFLLAGMVTAAAIAVTELASRSLLATDSEEALRRMTLFYRASLALLSPFVALLAPLVPRRDEEEAPPAPDAEEASEEEVEAFIDVGTREGILEPEDRDLVWGVVDFGDTQVRSVMTPRVDLVAAPVEESLDALARVVVESSVTRLPLYRGSIDQIVGILHIRDLLGGLLRDPRPPASELVRPAYLVPETKLLGALLKELKAKRQQMAVVINEFGGTEGVVTVEDLVEEIVGEIQDEYDDAQPENRLLEDGSLLLDGRAAIEVLDEFFSWQPEEETTETVGGLVSGRLGYVPQAGEELQVGTLRFLVENADERRILSLRVRRSEPVEEAADG